MTRSLPILFLALAAMPCEAEPYSSPGNRFSVSYAAPWSKTARQEGGAELLLLCDPDVCGPTARLGFGAVADSKPKGRTLADFLAQANSNDILQFVKGLPGVSQAVVIKEGRTKLGAVETYQVVTELTLQDGSKRVRHTFMTFNDGHVYFLFLGSPAEGYGRALSAARPVLDSFAFK